MLKSAVVSLTTSVTTPAQLKDSLKVALAFITKLNMTTKYINDSDPTFHCPE